MEQVCKMQDSRGVHMVGRCGGAAVWNSYVGYSSVTVFVAQRLTQLAVGGGGHFSLFSLLQELAVLWGKGGRHGGAITYKEGRCFEWGV